MDGETAYFWRSAFSACSLFPVRLRYRLGVQASWRRQAELGRGRERGRRREGARHFKHVSERAGLRQTDSDWGDMRKVRNPPSRTPPPPPSLPCAFCFEAPAHDVGGEPTTRPPNNKRKDEEDHGKKHTNRAGERLVYAHARAQDRDSDTDDGLAEVTAEEAVYPRMYAASAWARARP